MLSVVLPTLQRASAVLDAARDVLAQLPHDGELWVVDQSDDEAHEAVRCGVEALDDARLTLIRLHTRGLPNARNVALQRVRGSIVLFLDDDVRLEPGCLSAHIRAYSDPGVGGVGGRIHERTVRPNHPQVVNTVLRTGRVLTNLDGPEWTELCTLKGAHMSFRVSLLRQVGGFDRRYVGTALLEDADASTRVRATGARLVYCPEAVLTHLSVPMGGVRVGSPEATERWRFHNTGLFIGTHRPATDVLLVLTTFAGIAAKRAVEWGEPAAAARLMQALYQGLRASRTPPDHGVSL